MMRIEKISKSYADRVILRNLTYHFPLKERIALIGANGQGKTTLLKIMSNLEESDGGQVIRPKDMRLSVLPQSPNENPQATILEECLSGHQELFSLKQKVDEAGAKLELGYTEEVYEEYEQALEQYQRLEGHQLEGVAEKVLLGMGFKPAQLGLSPTVLSGGWRMRLELAKILVSKPDFLILDEPTNHLDLPSIEWLESYLMKFPGTLLFVSHDKSFLNNVSTITLYLNQGNLAVYKGNFDDFMEQKDQNQATQENTIKNITKKKEHMQRFVDRFKAKASKATQAKSRMKMIEKLEGVLSGIQAETGPVSFHIPNFIFPKSGKEVARLDKVDIGYDKPLIKKFSLPIMREEKIAIIGANGIGKSTLLKTISGLVPPLSGTVTLGQNVHLGHYTQDIADNLDKTKSVLETIQQQNPELSNQTQRALLGTFLFKGTALSQPVRVLSGGEKSRLALCCLLSKQPNFLLLDEPTNHLDILSTEVLGEMLKSYPGTLVFISHDRDFVENVATSVIEIGADGTVQG
ncbi:MAG: ABC-F family ATP-binding cassette domain-containing protein [Alphaproteobacteria bacterium]